MEAHNNNNNNNDDDANVLTVQRKEMSSNETWMLTVTVQTAPSLVDCSRLSAQLQQTHVRLG